MPAACPTCRPDESPRTVASPGNARALVTRELGEAAKVLLAAGNEAPPATSAHDRALNPDLAISYGEPGSWNFSSSPYEATDWYGYVRCGACERVWRVRAFRELVEKVTKESGAPNFDPVAWEYECHGSSGSLELLPAKEAASAGVRNARELGEALQAGLLPFEPLWRPAFEALRHSDPAGLAELYESTPRRVLGWTLREELKGWYETQPGRAVPALELRKAGRIATTSRPCPAVALGESGFAWIATTERDADVWHRFDLASGRASHRTLKLQGLSVNHRVFPEWSEPYAVVYLQEGTAWGLPSAFALLDPAGDVVLLRDGIDWEDEDDRHNAHVTVIGGQVLVPEGRSIVSLHIATNEAAFVVKGLPGIADGRVGYREDLLVFGLFDGLATWKPEGKVGGFVRPGPLVLCELDGLLVAADGTIERVFEGRKTRANVGLVTAAHLTDRHLSVVGSEGVEVYEPTTLEKLGAFRREGELHGSGLTLGVTALLGESLLLVDAGGRLVAERALEEEPSSLLTIPGRGFVVFERDFGDHYRFRLLTPDGRELGRSQLGFEREFLWNDAGAFAFLDGDATIRVGRLPPR